MRVIFFILSFTVLSAFGQDEKKLLRKGNKDYKKGDFKSAEKNYSESLKKKNNYSKGSFNLGDAYYRQGKYAEATTEFENLTTRTNNADTLSRVYHNLGNSLLKQNKFEESANAYKKSLKYNPKDEDTRYNLAYALNKLRQQQEQKKKEDEKKDKNKKDDKKDQNKKEDKKEQKKDEKKPQESQNKISKEEAQRMLEALNNEEKKVQEKLKRQRAKGTKAQTDKDW
jgi:Ca-activated chloride channel homolog